MMFILLLFLIFSSNFIDIDSFKSRKGSTEIKLFGNLKLRAVSINSQHLKTVLAPIIIGVLLSGTNHVKALSLDDRVTLTEKTIFTKEI